MKYSIEVMRVADGAEGKLLHSVVVDEMRPLRAVTRADELLSNWVGRGATEVRVLNKHGEVIYSWRAAGGQN